VSLWESIPKPLGTVSSERLHLPTKVGGLLLTELLIIQYMGKKTRKSLSGKESNGRCMKENEPTFQENNVSGLAKGFSCIHKSPWSTLKSSVFVSLKVLLF